MRLDDVLGRDRAECSEEEQCKGNAKGVDEQGIFEEFINFHNRSLITTSITIIWRGEDGHYIAIMRPVAVIVHHSSLDQVKRHDVEKEGATHNPSITN